jgi:phosphate:Na+ symporter
MDIKELQRALNETHKYADKIHLHYKAGADWEYLVAIIHIMDHLQRLHERCEEEEDRAISARTTKDFNNMVSILSESISDIVNYSKNREWYKAKECSKKTLKEIHKKSSVYRKETANMIASGEIDVPVGSDRLEAIRWVKRVAIHINRINHHLKHAMMAAGNN